MRICLALVFIAGCVTALPDGGSTVVEPVTACPAGQWCVEAFPIAGATQAMHGVWAVTAEDVFAVGDAGTILRRTSDVWAVMATPTSRNLRAVWAASSSDVWASGLVGTVLHFDGTAWTQLATGATSDLESVWGSGPSDVWFAGGGTVLHWTGAGFTSAGFAGTLLAISGTGPSDVWTAGESTTVNHWNGVKWAATSPSPISGVNTWYAVLALATSEVWITDFLPNKETVRWNGTTWAPQRTGAGIIFNGLSALASSDVWGVGGKNVGHWNGTAWTIEQPLGSDARLWSVTTTPGNAWVVGNSALIAHRSL